MSGGPVWSCVVTTATDFKSPYSERTLGRRQSSPHGGPYDTVRALHSKCVFSILKKHRHRVKNARRFVCLRLARARAMLYNAKKQGEQTDDEQNERATARVVLCILWETAGRSSSEVLPTNEVPS